METENKEQVEQKESVKLIKNTKGYNWEIRVLRIATETDEEYLNRLKQLNNTLEQWYLNESKIEQ